MKQVFLCVAALSVSGTFTGLLLLCIHPLTLKYFSKRWNYKIWILTALCLLLPVRVELFPLPALTLERMYAISDGSKDQDEFAPESGLSGQDKAMESNKGQEEAGVWEKNVQEGGASDNVGSQKAAHWIEILAGIWFSGCLLAFGIKLFGYRQFSRKIRSGSWQVTGGQVIEMTECLCRKLSMKKAPGIFENAQAAGPITFGFLRPVIVIPREGQEPSELSLMLYHELVHVKQKDLWYKLLFQILLCFHWFNPVLYLIVRRMNLDCELACDEAVARTLTDKGRRAYGNILINVAERTAGIGKNVLSTTLLERKEDLRERLKGISQYKRGGSLRALFSVCVFLCVLLLSACGGQLAPDEMPVRLSGDILQDIQDSLPGADFFDQPVAHDKSGEGWRAYDDYKALAGEDIYDQWHAYSYSGGKRIVCRRFFLTGTYSILIVNVPAETEMQVSSSFDLLDGKFKIVHILPDGNVTVITDTGEKETKKITLKQGRNVIKMAGQGAKLKNLAISYLGIDDRDIESIYYSEEEEYGAAALENVQRGTVDKEKLLKALPWIEDATISEIMIALLKQGISLSSSELSDFFIYSDSQLSSALLAEAVERKEIAPLDVESVDALMPYLTGQARMTLICAMEGELFFDALEDWMPYLSSSELEECLVHYMEQGNRLTYSQVAELSPYLNGETLKILDKVMEKEEE